MSSVQVAVRARPLSKRELNMGSPFCVEMKATATTLYKSSGGTGRSPAGRANAKEFKFDHSYWSVSANDPTYAYQENVFDDLGVPVLNSAFQGYNACVFAYGQTGSGKTYTMMGSEDSQGLIPRICEGLFSRMALEKGSSGEKVSYHTTVSYMEIYNEKVRDLLISGNNKAHSLRVREHPTEGPYVDELSKHDVTDYQGISELIHLGNSHRITAATKMNEASSRSHAIFTIKFNQATFKDGLPSETISKIHLVDLAGSERATATGAEGERLKEGGSINKSLVCLGTVISSLAEMTSHRKPFIPYRDSVLTWLLKDSLGGNSKTIMIATISPAESSYGETLSTLRYASRAKNIVNKPKINEDPNVKLIRDLRSEIQRLKTVISTGDPNPGPEQRHRLKKSTSISLAEDLHKKEEQFLEMTREWAAGKWKDVKRIVQENHLALHSDGVKMVVDSKRPHFVGIDPDVFSTGLVFYYLKEGPTTIGTRSEHIIPDICISNSDLRADHCQVECVEHRVVLRPLSGDCFLNHKLIRKTSKLSQGDLIQLGASTVFRFNHPHQAAKLRKKHNEGLLVPRKLDLGDVPPVERSPVSSPTLTTMTVELQSRTSVSTNRRRTNSSALTLAKSHKSRREWRQSESPTNVLLLDRAGPVPTPVSTPLALAPPNSLLDERYAVSMTRRSFCWTLILWLFAPIILTLAGVITVPAVALLTVLLVFFKVLGITEKFRITQWLTAPLTFSSFLRSPIAGLQALIFKLTFSLLKRIGVLQIEKIEMQTNGHFYQD